MHKTLQKQTGMNGVLLAFLLGMAGAAAIFLPFLIVDKGFFLYCGDYNAQQIPFYYYVQQFIRSGGGTWSWETDLGSSIISSYSFYNIGSPFLWLTVLFPTRWVPFLMVPLFMLKFGAIAAACCLYLSRYARTRNMAVICSLIYAFCGFNTYNIFFNHMLDPVAIFPLMLWALDGFIYEKKRGLFALTVGLSLLNSYFFFVGNVVFILIYFLVKVATREYRIDPKNFGLLALEAVLGLGIGMALALPSYYNLILNPRTSNFATGMGTVLYGYVHQYANIIKSIFLPPDPPYMANLFTEGVINWTSMSFFLPIVSIGGVAAYCKARKWTGAKIIMAVSLVMAMVPILNSSFYAFNASYYARWYYMPLLIMCFATLRALEDEDVDLEYGAKFSLIATGVYVIFALIPQETAEGVKIGLAQTVSKYWLTLFLAIVGCVIFLLLVKYYRKSVRFAPLLLSAVLGFSVFYTVIHISLGKFPQWDRDQHMPDDLYYNLPEVELPDDEFYRTDGFMAYENISLWMGKPSLQTFNSVVTPSIMEFYPLMGVTRDVNSKPDAWRYALRGLLSVRYTLVPERNQESFEMQVQQYGWSYWKTEGTYAIYTNDNYVPMGFTYDEYIVLDNLNSISDVDRPTVLMRAIGLTQDQITQYGHLFERELGIYTPSQTDDGSEMDTFQYGAVDLDSYGGYCDDRRASSSYEISADHSGFRSKIKLAKDNLVFFSVPYDAGFTATVNGQPTEILKVSGGLMAVQAPAGDNEIIFRYKTPGFSLGISITLLSLSMLCLYLVLDMMFRQRKKKQQVKVAAGPSPADVRDIEDTALQQRQMDKKRRREEKARIAAEQAAQRAAKKAAAMQKELEEEKAKEEQKAQAKDPEK